MLVLYESKKLKNTELIHIPFEIKYLNLNSGFVLESEATMTSNECVPAGKAGISSGINLPGCAGSTMLGDTPVVFWSICGENQSSLEMWGCWGTWDL